MLQADAEADEEHPDPMDDVCDLVRDAASTYAKVQADLGAPTANSHRYFRYYLQVTYGDDHGGASESNIEHGVETAASTIGGGPVARLRSKPPAPISRTMPAWNACSMMALMGAKPVPDASLRDTENVPLSEDISAYFKREVLPHAPDAWIDAEKTKVGYEIPFNRHFYVFKPPRPLAVIDEELKGVTDNILRMIGGLTA